MPKIQAEGEAQATVNISNRESWGKQIEFFLTIVGWAVGLGNVWRFPYLCYQHGGGTFLIPYIIMMVFVGLPVFFFELSLGQFAGVGPLHVWKLAPFFRGLGFSGIAITWMISMYYNVLIAWAWRFLFACFTSTLPWTTCNNAWNTPACIEGPRLKNLSESGELNNWLADRNLTNEDIKTPSEEYFYGEVLKLSDGIDNPGTPVWELTLCLLLSWLLCFLVLIKGIRSMGKVMYFVTIFPYIMMTVLVVRGATLEGARDGVLAYIKPDFNTLANAQMWNDAATQIFYTLGTCAGGLIAMASLNPFKNNILRDALLIPVINGCTSLYSGFAIFTVLGFMAQLKGVRVKDVVSQGPGLVFVVYPEALSQMPVAPLWAFFFFLMLITLGYSTLFAMVEAVFISVIDLFPASLRKDKKRGIIFRGVAITVYFFLTLPMVTNGGFYLFDITNTFVSGFPMLIVGLIQFVAISWVYGINRFAEDIAMMLGKKPNSYFLACWVAISPALLMAIIIAVAIDYRPPQFGACIYSSGANALGWLQVVFAVGWIPALAIFFILTNMKDWRFTAFNPYPGWGPALPENRTGRYASQPMTNKDTSATGGVFSVTEDPVEKAITPEPTAHDEEIIGHINEGYTTEKL